MFFAPVVRTRAMAPSLRSFDRNFERFVNDAFFGNGKLGFQAEQDEKAWNLSIDMPGVARDDLAVLIGGSVVRIETRAEAKRPYKAAYELAEAIDAEATTAKLENGVLSLSLAKKKPVNTARSIEVK
jgi:HSP20 family protein